MADGNSLGSDTQKRSWAFVYALLIAPENREGDPTQGEIRIVHKNWSDNRKNGHPALVVTAKKKPLIELIKKQKNILDKLSFTDEHFSAAYNTWLSKGKPFNILKDLRKNKKGVQGSLYHFELKLLANSTLPTDNEREFKKAWEEGKQSNREADSDCESFIQTSDPQCPNTITPPSIIYQNLPVPDYTTFVGRDKDVEQLLEFLSQPNVYRISVVGSGGLGKTRLVLEAVYRCLHASQNRDKNHNLPIFDSFIFTSAKQQRLTYKGLDTCTNPQSKIEDILRKIGDILEIPTINNIADQKELLEIIRKKLSYQQYDTLLIIDNLETMEDARNIHSFLYDELPTKLRVIVTSRQLLVLDKYITIRASLEKLEKIEIAREIKGLTLEEWALSAYTSVGTLKKFRNGLSIQQSAFVSICKAIGIDNWEEIVDKTPLARKSQKEKEFDQEDNLAINFIAYEDTWVGRESTITTIKQNISGSSRIVILNGITGIGKTALAEKLYTELIIETKWNKLLRVNFDNQDQSDFGNFVTVADRWLQECGVLVIPEDRQDIPRLQKKLIEYLKENHCLMIIDSLEWILKGNQEHGWSEFKDREWVNFFRLFLSELQCNSRIILTTQHLPEDVSAGYDNFWFCQPIKGLEVTEQLELFKKIGIETKAETEINYLKRIGKVYEGHALTLKVIAGTIKTEYQGNILAYWEDEGKQEIEKVEKDLESSQENMTTAWELHKANRDLYFKVRYKFNKTFERLKEHNYYSYLLICFASTYLSPHSKEDLLEHLVEEECSEKEQRIALQILMEEQLLDTIIQENSIFFKMHNLIRSVAYEHFQNL